MRVLLSAYVCAKDAGSEPEIGYTTLMAIHQAGHEVTVLTWDDSADRLKRDLASDGASDVSVVGLRGLRRLDSRLGRIGLGHVHYLAWQLQARQFAVRSANRFDVAHHVTFGSDWLPSGLMCADIPLVWGPVGGSARLVYSALALMPLRSIAQEAVREVVTRSLRLVTLYYVRRTQCLVVGHNQEVADWYQRRGCDTVVRPLVAMPPLAPAEPIRAAAPLPRRLVFVGRLTPWKGTRLAVRSLAQLPDEWVLDVYGTGKDALAMEELAQRLGIGHRLRMLGHRPKAEVWAALRTSDALLQLSIHDSAPQPVAQALRAGCPVICLDSAGPPILAGDVGTVVAPGRSLVSRLADAIGAVRPAVPDDRWSSARLPSVVDELYALARR